MISCAVRTVSAACLTAATSKVPSAPTNLIRFSDARLHALLSRCMYSLQGFEALMRPLAGHVCHSLTVVSNCMPGSAHSHPAWATSRLRSASPHGLEAFPRGHGLELPVLILLVRPHELVAHADRVVRVLVLDRVAVPAVEVHVEPGVAQRARLVLLGRLAPDEVADVRMVRVEDHHLRGATRLAAGLDRTGAGVGPPHEGHRAARGPPAGPPPLPPAGPRQVD